MCSMANQVRACDVHLSCVVCVCYLLCSRQNRVQQCMHTAVFEVLHVLNVQAHACTCMREKLKLSCTISTMNKLLILNVVILNDAIIIQNTLENIQS